MVEAISISSHNVDLINAPFSSVFISVRPKSDTVISRAVQGEESGEK